MVFLIGILWSFKEMKKTRRKNKVPPHTIDLKEIIQNISMKDDLQPEMIIETINEVMRSDFSDLIDLPERHIKVEVDEELKMRIFLLKKIVERKQDVYTEMTLEEFSNLASEEKGDNTPQLGEDVWIPFNLSQINRNDILSLNRIILGRIRGIKKDSLYQEYKTKEGSIIKGNFLRKLNRDMIISLSNAEGRLSYKEQVWSERYQQGETVRSLIKSVSININNQLNIELSRKDPILVMKLFENEVQEIVDGIIKVKSIVRDAGRKTKMAVFSIRKEVEPVGACIGHYGNRIKSVMKELRGERVDVIGYSDNIREYITRAISPGKVLKVLLINEKNKEALVVVDDASYPLAIGRNGINVKLASQLVGWELNVRTQTQMEKHPEILKVFSKIDSLFVTHESNLEKLTGVDEGILVKVLNAGINTIEELYDKSIEELERIEGLDRGSAKKLRQVLDEMVEVVESEEEARKLYREEMEDEIQDIGTEEEIQEEIQQVEFIVCPSCDFEFEYSDQTHCPNCDIEFEFD